MLTSFYNSIVRTVIPVVVAAVAGYALKVGLNVDSEALATVLGGLVGSGYYLVVRLVETKFPKFTWLLGTSQQPSSYSYDGTAPYAE